MKINLVTFIYFTFKMKYLHWDIWKLCRSIQEWLQKFQMCAAFAPTHLGIAIRDAAYWIFVNIWYFPTYFGLLSMQTSIYAHISFLPPSHREHQVSVSSGINILLCALLLGWPSGICIQTILFQNVQIHWAKQENDFKLMLIFNFKGALWKFCPVPEAGFYFFGNVSYCSLLVECWEALRRGTWERA